MATVENPPTNPLKSWRRKNRVTQAKLAIAVGVHQTLVSQWERGRCVPTLAHLYALLKRTGLPAMPTIRFFLRAAERSGVVVDFHRQRMRASR